MLGEPGISPNVVQEPFVRPAQSLKRWRKRFVAWILHLSATDPTEGSVADRCIRHAASTLYHRWKGVRAEALGETKLAFDDLVNQLYAGQDPPGVEEALETKHWTHAAFYPRVILFGQRCSSRDNFESERHRRER